MEDLVRALGLEINGLQAKCNNANKDAPRRKPAPKKTPPHAEDKVIAQSIVSFSANEHKLEWRSVPGRQATPPASPPEKRTAPESVKARKQVPHHILVRSADGTQNTDKGKHDSTDLAPADTPAEAEQTPAKKMQVVLILSSRRGDSEASWLPQMSATTVTDAVVSKSAPCARFVIAEHARQCRTVTP